MIKDIHCLARSGSWGVDFLSLGIVISRICYGIMPGRDYSRLRVLGWVCITVSHRGLWSGFPKKENSLFSVSAPQLILSLIHFALILSVLDEIRWSRVEDMSGERQSEMLFALLCFVWSDMSPFKALAWVHNEKPTSLSMHLSQAQKQRFKWFPPLPSQSHNFASLGVATHFCLSPAFFLPSFPLFVVILFP